MALTAVETKSIEGLFTSDPEPSLFTFDLPISENEVEEDSVIVSVQQLKRVIGLTSVIVKADCQYTQVLLSREDGQLKGISFLLTGNTEKLKAVLDQLFKDEEKNDNNE